MHFFFVFRQHSIVDMSKKSFDYLIKIMLLGDSAVGKTSLMNRYVDMDDKSSPPQTLQSHLPTMGVDFRVKHLTLRSGERVRLQIWDTAGQERFNAITSSYYKHADGVCLVYDVTVPGTFENIAKWLRNLDEVNILQD
jgi:small GTP-binding protein